MSFARVFANAVVRKVAYKATDAVINGVKNKTLGPVVTSPKTDKAFLKIVGFIFLAWPLSFIAVIVPAMSFFSVMSPLASQMLAIFAFGWLPTLLIVRWIYKKKSNQ